MAEREMAIFLQLLEQRLDQEIPEFIVRELRQLSLEQIETFGRNLLGYEAIADVLHWLSSLGSLDKQHQRYTTLLIQQFGDLPTSMQQQIQSLPPKSIAQLSQVQLDLASVEALQIWLDRLAK